MSQFKDIGSAETMDGRIDCPKDLIVSPASGKGNNKITLKLCLSVFGAVLGSFQYGYSLGVINAPEISIKSFMNATDFERNGASMPADKTATVFSFIVAIFALGGGLGGMAAGWWADYFGRKNGLLTNTGFGILAAILMFFSKMAGSYEMIIIGRFFIGVNCGFYTGLTPLYLAELATPSTRGALGVLHQLGVVVGLLVSQVLGFPELWQDLWFLLLGFAVVPCVLQILILPWCPESPRFLLITRGREMEAYYALEALRGSSDVQDEMEEMRQEARSQDTGDRVSIRKLFLNRSFHMPLLISVMMHLSQQLSGINGIFFFSTQLFRDAGVSPDTATHASSGVGVVMVMMTLVTIPLMDRAGRKTLQLCGLGGMVVASLLFTCTLVFRHAADWFNGLSIAVSLIYVALFALGPGVVPWLIVTELFTQASRPAAMSVAILVNWVSNFLVGYIFPYMKASLGDYVFLPFTGFIVVFWVFTFICVPETKGKTIEEVVSQWQQDDIQVKRASQISRSPREDSFLMS